MEARWIFRPSKLHQKKYVETTWIFWPVKLHRKSTWKRRGNSSKFGLRRIDVISTSNGRRFDVVCPLRRNRKCWTKCTMVSLTDPTILQNVTVITKCDAYYNLRQYIVPYLFEFITTIQLKNFSYRLFFLDLVFYTQIHAWTKLIMLNNLMTHFLYHVSVILDRSLNIKTIRYNGNRVRHIT